MRRLLLAVVWMVLWCGAAVAAPSYCSLTGSLLLPNGEPCANCNVTIRVPRAQEVGGVTFPVKTSSYTTDATGALPAGMQAARTLVVEITIDKTPPITVQIPNTSSADLSTLLLPPIILPTSTNINSLSSTLTVSKGGTGGAPSADDQVLVSSSSSSAAWRTLTDCNGAGEAVTYDTATNTWGCATGLGGGGSGNVSNTGTPADNQVAVWTDATTIEGTSGLTFSAGTLTATTFSGALSGNATTATALASNPSDCASDTYATTIAASGNLTCASITNASTTGTAVNTPSTLVLRDGSGNFAAGTVTAALSGNASTATALASNPSDCASDTYATAIDASGNLTCGTVTNAGLAGSIAMSKTLLTADAGVALSTNSLTTASAETGFLQNSTTLPATCGEGAVYQDTDSGGTETYTCTATNTWTKYVAATDNVATATALAANPTDCASDTYATTIDARGNLTCSTVTNAGLASNAVTSGKVQDGTIAANDMTEGFISSYAGTGLTTDTTTSPDSLKVASSITTTVTGSASLNTLLAGRAGTGNDTTLSTNGTGTLYGSAASANDLTLRSNSADTTTGAINLNAPRINLYSSFPAAPTGDHILLDSSPTTTLTGGSADYTMVRANPAISVADTTASTFFQAAGSVDRTGTINPVYQVTGFDLSTVFTSSTTGGPLLQDGFYAHPTIRQQGGVDATQNTWIPIDFLSKSNYEATGANTDLTIDQTFGYWWKPNVTAQRNASCTGSGAPYACCTGSGTGTCGTNSTVTLTTLGAVSVENPVVSTGGLIPNLYGVHVADLTAGTANTSLISVGAAVDMRHAGPARFGATGAPTAGKDLDVQGDALVDGTLDLGDGVADQTTGTTRVLDVRPTVDVTGTSGNLTFLDVEPTTTMSGLATMLYGMNFSPAVTFSTNNLPSFTALNVGGTQTSSLTSAGWSVVAKLMNHAATYTTSTTNGIPVTTLQTLSDSPTVSSTATSGSATVGTVQTAAHNPTISLNDTNGATGGVTALTVTSDLGYSCAGTYTETSGTLTVANRVCLQGSDVTNTSSATDVTNNFIVDIANLSVGTNRAGIRNADATVYTPCTDDVSSNTDYLARPECTTVNLTAGAVRDLTAGTDQIADGLDGQIVTYFFTGSNSVKFDDGDNVNLSSAGAVTLSAGDTLTLLFSSTRGEWLELSRSDN